MKNLSPIDFYLLMQLKNVTITDTNANGDSLDEVLDREDYIREKFTKKEVYDFINDNTLSFNVIYDDNVDAINYNPHNQSTSILFVTHESYEGTFFYIISTNVKFDVGLYETGPHKEIDQYTHIKINVIDAKLFNKYIKTKFEDFKENVKMFNV